MKNQTKIKLFFGAVLMLILTYMAAVFKTMYGLQYSWPLVLAPVGTYVAALLFYWLFRRTILWVDIIYTWLIKGMEDERNKD